MSNSLEWFGLGCVLAAIVGGNVTVKPFGSVPPLKHWQSLLLGLLGIFCLLAWFRPIDLMCKIPGVCKERDRPLFVGITDGADRGYVSVSGGQGNLPNLSVGYTIKNPKPSDATVPLYWGTVDNRNRGFVAISQGTFMGGAVEPYGYIYRDNPYRSGSTHLFVATGASGSCGSINGMVTTANPLQNCTTDSLGWTVP
jgi:hypothetical protein